MYISDYRRTDTVSYPGFLLSAVEVSDGNGEGISEIEVSNTIREDRDSLDGVLLRGHGRDILEIENVHKIVKALVPKHTRVIIETAGKHPCVLDDLVGAGYIRDISFIFDQFPVKTQMDSLDIARNGDCGFAVTLVLDPARMTLEDAHDMVYGIRDAMVVQLRRPAVETDKKRYRKNEMIALAKSFREVARDVKIF